MNTLDTLPRHRRILLWSAVLSGLLLAMLDQTIVGTALPVIVRELGGADWYVWGATAYLVPATVLLPVFARLSDRHGRQRMLLLGMGLFLLGSGLCATAQTMVQLCGFRALQGTGAAALEALSFMLVTELSGPTRRAAGQAALAGVMALSFLAGPLVGGLLTDHGGWRWVFLVNLPIGLAAMGVVAIVLPARLGRHESLETPIDLAGIVTLTASVGAVLVGLNQHVQVPTWIDPRTGGLVVAGLAGLLVLVVVEARAAAPVIPLHLLANPITGRLLAAGATATFALYACVLLVPRFYQEQLQVSATSAGIRVYPLLVGLLVAVNVGATVIMRRSAFRGTLLVGNAVVLTAAAGFAVYDEQSGGLMLLALMAVLGLGLGPALSGLQIAIGRAVRPSDLGAAMGTLLLVRQLGGAFALAAAEAVYRSRLAGGATEAAATGDGVAVVAAVGAGVAGLALLSLTRSLGRLVPRADEVVPERPGAIPELSRP